MRTTRSAWSPTSRPRSATAGAGAAPGDVFLFRRGELHGYRNARDQEPHLWLVHYEADEALHAACPRLADPDPERRAWRLTPEQLAGYQALFTRLMAEGMQRIHPAA